MIVIVIVGSLALFTLPRFAGLNRASKLAAARTEVQAGIATARAVAIQKGRPSQFSIIGNKMTVSVDTSANGQRDTVIREQPLDSMYQVTVTGPSGEITFDPRGWTTSAKVTYVLTQGARKDSVCFKKSGQIMPRGCIL